MFIRISIRCCATLITPLIFVAVGDVVFWCRASGTKLGVC